jgi:hypothetical protein
MICPGCQKETSLRLSTSGKIVCPECGFAPRPGVWFCPIHGKTVHPNPTVLAGAEPRAICPGCGHEVHPWSGDLPLPTEGNVRMLQTGLWTAISVNRALAKVVAVVANMGQLQGAEARFGRGRLVGDNKRGWWN